MWNCRGGNRNKKKQGSNLYQKHIGKNGHRALIIDPSLVLLEQWKTAIEIDLGFEVTSSIGGNYVRRIDMGCTVTIGTVQSVAPIGNALRNFFKLIVADECHRYGAETFQHALLPDVRYRMGLTATLERSDNGVDEVLVPYFNRKVLSYDFGQARKDRVIAPYGVACIGVKLSSQEQFDAKTWSNTFGFIFEITNPRRMNGGGVEL